LASNNYINNYSGQAISINGVTNGTYTNNIIGEGNSTHAIQIINGGKDIKIDGNKFTNSSRYSILINAKRMSITSISRATNAIFSCASDVVASGFHIGQRIYIREVSGMTQVNKRYFTITNISGKNFQVGLNTTSYGIYTGGGVVQERYRGISVTNNKFVHTKYCQGHTDGKSFYGYDYQSVCLKNNECYYESSLPNLGGYQVANLATTYVDNSASPILTSGLNQVLGTNIIIPFSD
jgi:hypothetical protein